MASKKSRLDLLVRVRYLNPLPPPPFPPKLFDIPSDISRLGEPSYLSQLASSTPLPMLVDSEMGMPLDLSSYNVWDGDDTSLLGHAGTEVDPEDAILLAPAAASKGPAEEVSWMRTSNLFMRKTQNKRTVETTKGDIEVDATEDSQIEAIEKTFLDISTDLKHPDAKKKNLTVLESYDLVPDNNWGEVSYIMMKFPDRPSGLSAAMKINRPTSPRLGRALLLPRDHDGQQEVDYFLPTEEDVPRLDDVFTRAVDAEVVEQVEEMDVDDVRIDEILPSTHYERTRTYETVSAVKPQKEVLLTFNEGQVEYREVFMRTLLRKARAKRDDHTHSVDKMRVGYRRPTVGDDEARMERQRQVLDPTWAEEQLLERD